MTHLLPRRSELGPRGSTRAWRRRRARIMRRDRGLCRLRLEGCTTVATTVDHLVPRAKGGGDADHNLVAACERCNRAKGARPLDELTGVGGVVRTGNFPAGHYVSGFLSPNMEPPPASRAW